MSRALEHYLDQVMAYANRDEEEAQSVRAELEDHLLEKVERLAESGLSREDAIFQALQDQGDPRIVGYSLRPRFPLVDVRTRGTARGVIAVGPKAIGVFAFGGTACGVIAFGGLSAGLITMGGLSVALLFTWSGIGLAPLSFSGIAVGILAAGGAAVGVIAQGAIAIGMWSQGEIGLSYYDAANVPAWMRWFDRLMSQTAGLLLLSLLLAAMLAACLMVPWLLTRREQSRLSSRGITVFD